MRRQAEKVVTTKKASYLNTMTLASDARALRHAAWPKIRRRHRRTAYRIDPKTGIAEVDFIVDLGFEIEVGQTEYLGLPLMLTNLDRSSADQSPGPIQATWSLGIVAR